MEKECPNCGKKFEESNNKIYCSGNCRGYSWRKNNPEKTSVIQKNYRKNHPEKMTKLYRKYTLQKHGITQDEYDEMLKNQKGMCAICGQKKFLVIDHNHITQKIRGLLCFQCNNLLGFAEDNIETLKHAIDYIENKSGYPGCG